MKAFQQMLAVWSKEPVKELEDNRKILDFYETEDLVQEVLWNPKGFIFCLSCAKIIVSKRFIVSLCPGCLGATRRTTPQDPSYSNNLNLVLPNNRHFLNQLHELTGSRRINFRGAELLRAYGNLKVSIFKERKESPDIRYASTLYSFVVEE